ncbi:enoyl-CoA hydratase/isomerase family protein [Nocardia sp. BSTN01]|uniref:enoyl-CoA hydratase/isomerase family protein n=1 Tax=Nocardia sp. BSTN01 TaxID=2783665 RepID=UPI00188EA000|nr:enoyl-CoA hydratase/isomerase family protein [Nocardia sp. BSTN01]MBF4997328.1 enoyl-CoA hydratase/isomerase family protein [Nocardia sp. BSTN01]
MTTSDVDVSTTPVSVRTEGRVRYLTINRPDALNALNREVLATLAAELDAVRDDVAIGAVVLSGAGGRAFCAGADLSELAGLDVAGAHAVLQRGQRVMSAVEELPVPVIAAVDGYALGGGFELALSCPVILASERSRFGLPESKLGLVPGYGGTQRLRRAVGRAPALAVMLTGQPIDAGRAWHLGLLSEPPVPSESLLEEAGRLAAGLAELSRANLGLILESARSSADGPEGLRHEAALAAMAIGSADGQEGAAAFLAKRAPRFSREGSKQETK